MRLYHCLTDRSVENVSKIKMAELNDELGTSSYESYMRGLPILKQEKQEAGVSEERIRGDTVDVSITQ